MLRRQKHALSQSTTTFACTQLTCERHIKRSPEPVVICNARGRRNRLSISVSLLLCTSCLRILHLLLTLQIMPRCASSKSNVLHVALQLMLLLSSVLIRFIGLFCSIRKRFRWAQLGGASCCKIPMSFRSKIARSNHIAFSH